MIKIIFIFFASIFIFNINNILLADITISSWGGAYTDSQKVIVPKYNEAKIIKIVSTKKTQKISSEIINNKLTTLKKMFDEGLINNEEYNKKRKEFLILEEVDKLKKLKSLLDNKLINQKDYDRKRKEILGIENIITTPNNQDNYIKPSDTTGPTIVVAKSFQANQDMTAIISGNVSDESEIVSFTINGNSFDLNNGSFSLPFFVQPEGQTVEIIAVDIRGNKSNIFVKLKRTAKVITTKTFDFLDPRKLKVKTKPNAVALIIGVEEYQKISAAPFAKKDALFFKDFAQMSLGVPQENIKMLINVEASRSNILDTLVDWLPKFIEEKKTDLYIFYSGHGLASEDGEDLFLLPTDGVPKILADTALLRNKIFDIIDKLNPKSVTVFLDTCYSGASRTDEFLVASRQIFIEPEEQEIPSNFTVFSASAGKETAKILEEAEHGLFSYYLMKGLEGKADSNNDQQITYGELHSFINKKVTRQASQTPQLSGNHNQVLMQW